MRRRLTVVTFGTVALVLAGVVNASAASNTVPNSSIGDSTQTISVDARKPEECNPVTVTTVSVASGNFTGTNANELILGRTAAQTLDGSGGGDCILGGGGNDTLRGNTGNDVLLGGPGDDNISGGNGTDTCYGGGGNDTFNRDCETQVP